MRDVKRGVRSWIEDCVEVYVVNIGEDERLGGSSLGFVRVGSVNDLVRLRLNVRVD